MKVARVTVTAISHGFRLGFQAVTGAGWGRGRGSAAAALIRFLSLVEARAEVADAETEKQRRDVETGLQDIGIL
jgi:hypothetical protein